MSQTKRKSDELDSSVVDPNSSKRVRHSIMEKKRPSFLGTQTMVTVNVSNRTGTSKQSFLVYKSFIYYYSPFFDAAFNGGFEESEKQTLDLPDVKPAAFGLFVQWLYTQKVLDDDHEEDQPSLSTLVELWILADRLLVPRLQNETIIAYDARRIILNERPSRTLKRIYANTTAESPLRQYIIQLAATGSQKPLENNPDLYPRQLLIDIIYFMNNHRPRAWMKFSEEELSQFFVADGETEENEAEEDQRNGEDDEDLLEDEDEVQDAQ